VIGLVGILILAKQKGFIPSVKAILSELQEKAGFWISNQLLQTVMTLANES
jgi:predicted nucleic acid-binding protein